ncbi:glycoside hydrolase family 2 [Marinimicrobium agarilyticum]|uniref:glycoside hydrolase family 2 n=1 Tax=Marinimicrobium agarilyticum TaxID=306546 RepID=UPI0004879AE5|nr:glycoside hydrolase family 2 [Marinimicrobium agarilyticum]
MTSHKTTRTGLRTFLVGLVILGSFGCQQAQVHQAQIPDHGVWPRPEIIPVPAQVSRVTAPVISLDGTWKFTAEPPEEFWLETVNFSNWQDIRVPAQASFHIEDLAIRRNELRPSYVYKRVINIPEDYTGKRVKLRFQGVTGDATVWVNGTEVGRHHGGFTIWNPDITEQVTPGEEAVITVSVHEPEKGQSTNTYHGGIVRGVDLMALPKNHITRFHIDSDLDSQYKDAQMNVWVAMAFAEGTENAELHLTLEDPSGQSTEITPSVLKLSAREAVPCVPGRDCRPGPDTLSSGEAERIVSIPVANPGKWSAEHPQLYRIRADLSVDGVVTQSVTRQIGFREVEIDGQRLLVNGNEVKLRGSAQFDSHPLNGISLTKEEAIRDLNLYKEANHNFVRPSCYIANEDFLEAADRIGIYVMGEMPVTFAHVAADDESLLPIFMEQTAETIEQARNHPSILFWMLANETHYGFNIGKMADYVFSEDPSLPVAYSWSQSVPPDQPLPFNIYSYHYPGYDADLAERDISPFNSLSAGQAIPPMPVIADEFAHPSSYNYEEMRRDPNVRNFWGETIDIFWERMFTTHGSLGGAIFAGIDHPLNLTRQYPWGILDKWRRPKPEYWHTKKAFSPVRLENQPLRNPGAGNPLELPVSNWFDHTNLNAVTFFWSVAEESGEIPGPDVAPRGEGRLVIPGRNWQQGDQLDIVVRHNRDERIIDQYRLAVEPPEPAAPTPAGALPDITETAESIQIVGADFTVTFSKRNGLIDSGTYNGTTLIQSGPFLNIIGVTLDDWSLQDIAADTDGNEAVVRISGSYLAQPEPPRGSDEPVTEAPVDVDVEFIVRVDGQGLLTTTYTIADFPLTPPETRLVPWNETDAGGYGEVGVSYLLTDSIDQLAWARDGLWSVYPEDHIGRNAGMAPRSKPNSMRVGVEPDWPWSLDETDFHLFGADDPGRRGTNDFRSMKEYIHHASAIASDAGASVRAESAAQDAVRLEVVDQASLAEQLPVADSSAQGGVMLHVISEWNYRHLGLGNYMKPPVLIGPNYSNTVYLRLAKWTGQDRD